MGEEWKSLLIQEGKRVFLDIAYRGCGNGCKYCYVPSASEEQKLASYKDLSQAIECLNNYPKCPQIISFCPNTEPFKTAGSIDRVLFVLRGLQDQRYHIQISTKEYMSNLLLQKLNLLAEKNKIFINISIPFLESYKIEPGASNVEQRILNLERVQHYSHLKCGLYIKPCTQKAIDNVDQYIAIAKRTHPDYVCVGVIFEQSTDIPCTTLHRKKDAIQVITTQKNLLVAFAAKIRISVQCPVVYSSVCAISQLSRYPCLLNLWQYDIDICNGCKYIVSKDID